MHLVGGLLANIFLVDQLIFTSSGRAFELKSCRKTRTDRATCGFKNSRQYRSNNANRMCLR